MTWKDVLEGARQTQKRVTYITARELHTTLEKHFKPPSLTLRTCSAWLAKFRKWGYVKNQGAMSVNGTKRWIRLYELTRWGREYGKLRKPPKEKKKGAQ